MTILAPADAVKPSLILDTSGLPPVNDIWSVYDSAQADDDGPFSIRSPASRGVMLPTPPPEPLLSGVLDITNHRSDRGDAPLAGGSGWPLDGTEELHAPERKRSGKTRQSEPILSNPPTSPVVRQQSKRYGRIWDFDRRTTIV